MSGAREPAVEVESLADFDARVAAGAGPLSRWHFQGLDLSGHGGVLRRLDVAGAVFLGCTFGPGDEQSVRDRGALVFPPVPGTPVDVYRPRLYSPQELYAGLDEGYERTLDARAYAWARQEGGIDVTLAQSLHDHAVDDALRECVEGADVVGMMGGHVHARGSREYGDAARLGRELARDGLLVATGGGPGAMEAANLGAYLSGHDDAVLEEAIEHLGEAPHFHPEVDDWARTAFEVLERWPDGTRTLGIPSWHYGHEPPNPFATHVAKYFKNAIREDVLLHLCSAGIVFLPGAGGTVQEIFQDACENYYAESSSVASMVLVGRAYWTEVVPAWPLLVTLARGRAMESAVHLVDDPGEVAPLLGRGRRGSGAAPLP